MADYDLSGLSTRSFEKLIQALAVQVLGPATVVFGDGPDGGREAIFEGKMQYPAAENPWNGYCVIQAKFKQRPDGPPKDGDWALDQLQKELEAFADRQKRRRIPDYYVYATNVLLTPVNETGSKDKAAALFNRYRSKLPIRGYALWDFDQIAAYLDAYEGIRRTYAAWTTPGDVLAEVLRGLGATKPNFGEVMINFLAKELAADQYIRLEQAGYTRDERIPLGSVFVDLPVTATRLTEPPEDDEPGQGFATEILEAATDRLGSASFDVQSTHAQPAQPERGRFVLVGGPGQGKTTIGQFLCQLFRAALLRDHRQRLAAEVRDALDRLLASCDSEKIGLPKSRRFPFRVVLNEFAAELSRALPGEELSLLSYLVAHVRKRTNCEIRPEDFRGWLASYPWLLVLDGLDEVPATSNRDRMLKAIEDFWTDAAQCKADLLVIATTRPQGYNDDFSPKYYQHRWLAPLSERRAMRYAERLADAKFGDNISERLRVLERLQEAATHDTTTRLMRSPLQVTILFTLVEHGGVPPRDRWRLFNDYYQTILRREKQRPIPAAALLRDHNTKIDIIHGRVALILQVESERNGGSEAKLPEERFRSIVEDYLIGEGFEGTGLSNLIDQIIEAAKNRLVFLVGVGGGDVGFEITSLREFMAAQALFEGEGDREEVQKRLEAIAPAIAWRNVFLFAAGRCFAEQRRRDAVCIVCDKLNDDLAGPIGRAIRAGSLLALELLEDGMARQQPTYARLLAHRALGLLDLPPMEAHSRLSWMCEGNVEAACRDVLSERLGRADPDRRLGAWAVLPRLASPDHPWAVQLARQYWERDPEARHLQLFWDAVGDDAYALWSTQPVASLIPRMSPRQARGLYPLWNSVLKKKDPPPWLEVAFESAHGTVFLPVSHVAINLGDPPCKGLATGVVRLEAAGLARLSPAREMPPGHVDWISLIAAAQFATAPSKDSLAGALRQFQGPGALEIQFKLDTPWPLLACLLATKTTDDLLALAQRAETGDLGDLPDWRAAEKRWESNGITTEDLHYGIMHWPFDRNVATRGFPFSLRYFRQKSLPDADYAENCSALISLFKQVSDVRGRAWLADYILALLEVLNRGKGVAGSVMNWLEPGILRQVVAAGIMQWLDLDLVRKAWPHQEPGDEWVRLLNAIWSRPTTCMWEFTEIRGLADVAAQIRERPELQGLIRAVALAATSYGQFWEKGETPVDLTGIPLIPSQFVEPHLREGALMVRLAQGPLQTAEAEEWAKVAAGATKANPEIISLAQRCINTKLHFGEGTERFLLALLAQPAGIDVKAHQSILAVLHLCFRRRRSDLGTPNRWRDLNLPESMLTLLPG